MKRGREKKMKGAEMQEERESIKMSKEKKD